MSIKWKPNKVESSKSTVDVLDADNEVESSIIKPTKSASDVATVDILEPQIESAKTSVDIAETGR